MRAKFLIKGSVTATAFMFGIIVVNLKYLLAGMSFGSIILAPMSGAEYAACLVGLGGVYILRRHNSIKQDEQIETISVDGMTQSAIKK